GPRPGVAGAADPPVAVGLAALVRHGRQADVAGELPAVGEGAVEHLAREHGGEVRAHAPDEAQGGDLAADSVPRLGGERRVARGAGAWRPPPPASAPAPCCTPAGRPRGRPPAPAACPGRRAGRSWPGARGG